MLSTLRIRNIALVADLTWELAPGYVAITGETGAGKSILIDALGLVLGGRADRTLLRSGAENGSVEAVFELPGSRAAQGEWLGANGLEAAPDGLLVLKRTITAAGANRQYVNGAPTSLAILSRIGDGLVDFHGAHEHQSLLHPARQLAILDAFGGLEDEVKAVREGVLRRQSLDRALAESGGDERTQLQRLDLLRFQAQEIEAAQLRPEEEQELDAEYTRAHNAARLLDLAEMARQGLSDDEGSVRARMGEVGRLLRELGRLDPGAEGFCGLLDQAGGVLQDLERELSRYRDRIDIDPARLQALEDRLNLIQSLKRKYGSTVAEVLRYGALAREELAGIEGRAGSRARIEAEREALNQTLIAAGHALSKRRQAVIPRLVRHVLRQLQDLGFRQSRFDILLAGAPPAADAEGVPAGPGLTGFDGLEFQFSPNPGEPMQPLRAIASSGELARVMLALKTVLAAEDNVPVLVFDEVDANVGGETANVLGVKMRQIAGRRQVLCITHLAPVAARASAHYAVTKHVRDGRSVTEIEQLDREGRIRELARMLGGASAAARRHAEALVAENTAAQGA
ncbi:MAG TPA: DNA repair protein RecN [Verrucomicrobiota bacterium]|nr:DNA repair protein RecN [Verrucomicrobiota bacterium]HNU51065.1 DNA repair protein RecN [Verrucomicrobiota bacterium]